VQAGCPGDPAAPGFLYAGSSSIRASARHGDLAWTRQGADRGSAASLSPAELKGLRWELVLLTVAVVATLALSVTLSLLRITTKYSEMSKIEKALNRARRNEEFSGPLSGTGKAGGRR